MHEVIKARIDRPLEVKKNNTDANRREAGDRQVPRLLSGSKPQVIRDWKRPAAIGHALIAFTFFILGGWSAIAKLDSAVTAPGVVAEGSGRKSVQHLEGGIIKEIFVREGERVTAGQVLFRLDPTQAQSSFELLKNQLDALLTEEARLIAERDRSAAIVWPEEIISRNDRATVRQAIADQTKQFTDRKTSLRGQINLLQSKIGQLKIAIRGMQVERDATNEQLHTITEELKGLEYLLSERLVPKSRVLALQREKSRLEGSIGRSMTDEAKAENEIGEAELQIQQVQNKVDEEVARAIVEVRQKISDTREKMHLAQHVFQRVDITAPVGGTAQDLKIFTIGGVIKPGDVLLQIVPDHDTLIVQAHVSPHDMDRMWAGMRAEVRFSSFKSSLLPIILGRVESVSRDRLVDETNREPYFLAQVVVDDIPEELRDRIVAGMPAELVFPTGERTVLNYLIRPLQDRMNSAFRER
ncbi:MAG: HlyD family type I secretion periplasmic adaptor subunit [Bradyrhizobium sp.]|nr:HlyD family type I secretion periplasmic adaptor subunit [Bradyrhizobium sp.]